MSTTSKCSQLLMAGACVAFVFTMGAAAWPEAHTLDITLTGQSMIRSDIRVYAPSAMSTITQLLKGDVIFTNLEATVSPLPLQGRRPTPPEALDALRALGFNLLSLSNNHAWDLKVPGIQNTLHEVSRLNLAHAGTGNTVEEAAAPGYLHIPGGTVALVAMASGAMEPEASATATRPGTNELGVEAGNRPNDGCAVWTEACPRETHGNKPNERDAQRILQRIREASKLADIVIVSHHNHVYDKPFGMMFQEELPERFVPPDWIKKWTHREVDAGADIVAMHGAPLVQGVEIYHNRPIFYDLGNFILQLPPTESLLEEPLIWESVVASVEFQGKNLQSIKFVPILLNKLGRGQPDVIDDRTVNLFLATRGLPTRATGEKARYIIERLTESSRPFGTTIELKGDTAEINLKGRIKTNLP